VTKKILIIDSHKSTTSDSQNNLHWLNARQLALALDADLIWSHPLVNIDIRSGYEIIIFIHASSYEYVEYDWLKVNPDAKIFYITNEYNLGEPRILWKDVKEGKRRYEVIANHPAAASKVVKKYVDNWHIVNLNALCFNPYPPSNTAERVTDKIIYYGSFRKDRAIYFQKYFNSDCVIVSTHNKNVEKLSALGCYPTAIPRIDWHVGGLFPYAYSLYIEDVKTHTHYNFLANRFYESLNFGVTPLFDISCSQTLEKSGYDIDASYIIEGVSELKMKLMESPSLKQSWLEKARQEKADVIYRIADIVGVPVVLPNLDSLNVRNRTIEYEDPFG
jgi:hypothetical protein